VNRFFLQVYYFDACPARRFYLLAWLMFLSTVLPKQLSADDAVSDGWHLVPVPESWKRQPGGAIATKDGYAWYRCHLMVPAEWSGKQVELNVEPIDDARQTFVNGVQVISTGTFPPQYRSGLGAKSRFQVPEDALRFGEVNQITVRTYMKDSRSNFLVAAPALLVDTQAIKMEGQWEYRPGDDKAWATVGTNIRAVTNSPAYYSKVDDVDDIDLYLRRRQGDTDPLPPSQALASFDIADDLQLDLVVAEPHVNQPLFINWDERGRLWVLNYQQYPYPAGLKMLSRDKFLRTVYDRKLLPPPHGTPGLDNITIHEDTNGDGSYDKHKTFVTGLNITSSFVRGRGGVYVLSPPHLLFYPDADNDDVPDGDPEVLLEGFGIEDSHSIANSLCWGPDGWMYACQGSTVTGQIKEPGSKASPIHSMGQLIWRYHPESKVYETFAEGGGNTFGCEIDDKGRIFSGTNGGNARGFHYVQGAYEQKGFGKHGQLSNPYAFGYFPAMKHHDVPRFTHNFVIYSGATLPKKYHGRLFGIEPMQGQIVQSYIHPNTTTFATEDIDRPVQCRDQWFRPVDIKVGPDGAVYFCDMYEQRIDHASHHAGRVTPNDGRIYRFRAKGDPSMARFDYGQSSTLDLVKLLLHPNKWHRQTAIRLFADRRDASIIPVLEKVILENTDQLALEGLWALNASGGFNADIAATLLNHDDQYVRLWTVRLLVDNQMVTPALGKQLAEMAAKEGYPNVRSQLACSAKRLPAANALPIIRNLLSHDEDLTDLHIPLLLWWALEAKTGEARDDVVAMFERNDLWKLELVKQQILDKLIRRLAIRGTRQDLLACARLLEAAPDEPSQKTLIQGFEKAFSGRSLVNVPDDLLAAIKKVGGGSLSLQVRQGIPQATADALETISKPNASHADRLRFVQIFGEVKQPAAVPLLIKIVQTENSEELRLAALLSLQSYSNDAIAQDVLTLHNELPESLQTSAQSLLASRENWARLLLNAVVENRIAKEAISKETLKKLQLHNSDEFKSMIRDQFGDIQGATTAQMQSRINSLDKMLRTSIASGNPYVGKVLYQETCGKCHKLFTQGGEIGPDLTSFKRTDSRGILLNVINPSAEIRKGFENYTILTREGRIVTGFLVDQDNQVVVIRGIDGQNVVLQQEDIDEMIANPKSVMPEGLLDKMSDEQIRHLFAYLSSTQPLSN
jgi:putative membrane-bound dehydrogenase-like protein